MMQRVLLLALVACGKSAEPPPPPPPPPAPLPKPPTVPVDAAPDAPRETHARGRGFSMSIPDGFTKANTGPLLAGGDVGLVADGPQHIYVARMKMPGATDLKACQAVADRLTQTGAKLLTAEIVKTKLGTACRTLHRDDKTSHMILGYTISLGDKDMILVSCTTPSDPDTLCKLVLDDVKLED